MKILYITTVDCSQDSGVRKKIFGQVNAIQKAGIEVKIVCPMGNNISLIDKGQTLDLDIYSNSGFFRFFKMTSKLYRCAYKQAKVSNSDAVFIRYSISDWNLLKLLKKLYSERREIFIEIPSYPYDMEYDNKQWYKRIGLYIDQQYRNSLHKYVNRIYTPSPNQENIFGIETEYFENGIDIESVGKREYVGAKQNTLRLVAVANINAWHGYDRVIKGIAEYYKNGGSIDIVFNVVGDGIELPNLKKLASQLRINDKVVFHGRKYGDELDSIYDNSDIAVSSIGFFRLNSIQRTSLKTREACLKGIPFISVEGDPTFDKDFKYMYLVEDNDSPLNIQSIYNWYIDLNPEIYIKEMNEFAIKYLSWDSTFKNVISDMIKVIKDDKRYIK